MKKMILGAVAFAALAMASAASAQSTTVSGSWNGNGSFGFNASGSNSSTSTFSTQGNGAVGAITYGNLGNNPYGYLVSNTSLNVDARVAAGGFMTSQVVRDGSYAPLYGAAGQSITASAFSSDGAAALVQHVGVNYAGMSDIGYGQSRTAGGNTLDASGTTIELNYVVNTGAANNSAGFLVQGTGSAAVLLASSGVSANGYGMGQGQGIFSQGQFSGTGQGTFTTGGVATGSLFVANSGSTIYGTAANPASITTIGNYATTGAQIQNWNFVLGGTR